MEEPTATTTSTTHYFSIFTNKPSLLSRYRFHSHSIHQTLFTSWYRERRWDLKQLLGPGGMPSSHSSTVTALAIEIGLQEGFGGSPSDCVRTSGRTSIGYESMEFKFHYFN
ncbi:unnamed protein product [Brassica napus]|uniref:(rape) hypothetical protein n=1 Tax=Brassica napus TaxID=3708 RepID=A0A816KLW5_BRANA|nr:unnamed protein product [Brassica napus]